jgi:hypothetical protein
MAGKSFSDIVDWRKHLKIGEGGGMEVPIKWWECPDNKGYR